MRAITTILYAILCSSAIAAQCQNCGGDGLVGDAVQFPCVMCDATGRIDDPVAVVQGVERRVVARVESWVGNETDRGSGVLVAKNGTNAIVLTNSHVVNPPGRVVVHLPGGEKLDGKVVAEDKVWDLAAILIPAPAATPVTLASDPKPGDVLTLAGYGPYPHSYREDTGKFVRYENAVGRNENHWLAFKADARDGDSGGPVFNAKGELAGVLWGSIDGETRASCPSRLRTFLSGVRWPTCESGVCRAK